MGVGNSKLTLQEQMRINKRAINKGIRELDRERNQLAMQEKKLIAEIKTMAKKGQMASTKILAKDLVRTRRYQQKFMEMRCQLQGVNLRLQTMKSTESMAGAMKGVTMIMVRMNKQLDIPALNKIMKEFMQENERMEMMQEVMGDTVDDAMADEGDEDEESEIVKQILGEIGLELGDNVPDAQTGGPVAAPPQKDTIEEDLETRLNALKR
eukprot:GEMP01053525.1.p1 GENE.GEMP01053525.1~~GEMP01053525.1.p1  ORF type:complete len:240 (+),score=43.68 GEMP01053525.1:93-722(+)